MHGPARNILTIGGYFSKSFTMLLSGVGGQGHKYYFARLTCAGGVVSHFFVAFWF